MNKGKWTNFSTQNLRALLAKLRLFVMSVISKVTWVKLKTNEQLIFIIYDYNNSNTDTESNK